MFFESCLSVFFFFFLSIPRPPGSTLNRSSAASDVYKRQVYEITYVFTAGRYDIDKVRIYMPFAEAQSFFNREGFADEIEVMVADPEHIEEMALPILNAAGPEAMLWTCLLYTSPSLRDRTRSRMPSFD